MQYALNTPLILSFSKTIKQQSGHIKKEEAGQEKVWGFLKALPPLGQGRGASLEAPLAPQEPPLRQCFAIILRTQKWPGELARILLPNKELTPLTTLFPIPEFPLYSKVTALLLKHTEPA